MKRLLLLALVVLLMAGAASVFGTVINPNGTDMHSGPGVDTGFIVRLDYGQNVKFTGNAFGDDTGAWWTEVKAFGGLYTGWVLSEDVE